MHDWLRAFVERLREDTSAPIDDLRVHCLAFCAALTRHHSGEDGTAFGVLRSRFPSLGPVLETLSRDHRQIEELLDRLQALLESGDRVAIGRELDGIAVLMESHFFYEEKKLLTALDALDVPEWERERPAFLDRDPD